MLDLNGPSLYYIIKSSHVGIVLLKAHAINIVNLIQALPFYKNIEANNLMAPSLWTDDSKEQLVDEHTHTHTHTYIYIFFFFFLIIYISTTVCKIGKVKQLLNKVCLG